MSPTGAPPLDPPATPEDLFRRLDGLGVDYRTHHHRPVFTVEESRDLRGSIPGAHCKSLFVRDKKARMFLVVVLEDRRMDLKALAGLLDCGRLSFGSPDRLMTYLGVTPGSVTPFALINDPERQVQPVLDAEMMQADLVNYHPLQNDMMTSVAPSDLSALSPIAVTGRWNSTSPRRRRPERRARPPRADRPATRRGVVSGFATLHFKGSKPGSHKHGITSQWNRLSGNPANLARPAPAGRRPAI